MIHPINSCKINYAYSLKEIMKYGLANLTTPYTADYPLANSTIFARTLFSSYGVDFPANTLIPNKYIDDSSMGLLNGIIERYWDEYVFISDENMENPMDILSHPEILYKTRRFLGRVVNIVMLTYSKYSAILNSYETEKTHLLDQMNKSISGSDTRRDNDTPQDGGTFDDDNHTSFISQGEVSNEESWDDTPVIERLDKISKLYELTMKKWLDEFSGLFTEGGNIHEL